MSKPTFWQLIWFFAFLIIAEVVWLDIRIEKLVRQSPQNVLAKQQEKINQELRKVPEPKVEESLISGASLRLEPKEASFSEEFTLKISAKSNEEIARADLRIFYPQEILQVIDSSWIADEKTGTASWSGRLSFVPDRSLDPDPGTEGTEGLVKTIRLRPVGKGEAKINFDFTKESLLDCNLLNKEDEDLLEEASGGDYLIK